MKYRPAIPSRVPLLPALGAALLLAACETVVDVPPPPHTPQLVAQGFFGADSLWTVRVTHTIPFGEPASSPFVEDAVVEIWEEDRLVARPARTDSGTYVARGSGAVSGRTYTLRVSAPGYPPTEGSDALPPPPPVIAFRESPVPADDPAHQRRTRVEVTLQDPPGRDDHYGLLVIQGRWRENRRTGQVRPLPPSLLTFESDDPVLNENTPDFFDAGQASYRDVFFPDDRFDGSAYTVGFDVEYDAPDLAANAVIRHVFAVVLLSVSEDFFRFWKTAQQQALTNQNPFAEPLRVHANMTSGFGVFAGFQHRLFLLDTGDAGAGGYGLSDLCHLIGNQLPLCSTASSVP